MARLMCSVKATLDYTVILPKVAAVGSPDRCWPLI